MGGGRAEALARPCLRGQRLPRPRALLSVSLKRGRVAGGRRRAGTGMAGRMSRHGTAKLSYCRAWAAPSARRPYAARHGSAAVPRRAVPRRARARAARLANYNNNRLQTICSWTACVTTTILRGGFAGSYKNPPGLQPDLRPNQKKKKFCTKAPRISDIQHVLGLEKGLCRQCQVGNFSPRRCPVACSLPGPEATYTSSVPSCPGGAEK